ncbi:DUF4355 domain-containing protein [Brevibacillus formosus]|uniref:DUF4355 domain-containing protein n=1 Tax=Brevibacillus formosus TaxID=54913 RepID=UPI003F1BA526
MKKSSRFLFPVDLQTFAEGGEESNGGQGNPSGEQPPNNVQAFTLDAVQKWFNDDAEAKKWFQSQKDAHFTKGLETWQKNNMSKLIDEEIAKRYPPETEEQMQLRELKQQFEQEKQARVRQELKNKALAIATEKSLPTGLVDFFVGADEDTTLSNLGTFEQAFNAAVQASVEAKFKQGGRQPHDSGSQTPDSLQKQLEDAAERARRTGRDEDMAAYSALKLQMMQAQQK